MARVPYVDYESAPETVRSLYDGRLAFTGRISNFHKILGHVPWIYRWHLGLQASLAHGPLPKHIKRLVHVQTSLVNQCAYCTSHNLALAAAADVPPEKVSALQSGELDDGAFTEAELAAVRWAATVANNTARPNNEAFAELQRHFTPGEIVELTYLVAYRTLTNRIQEALWTDLEEDEEFHRKQRSPRPNRGNAGLQKYAREVLLPQLEQH